MRQHLLRQSAEFTAGIRVHDSPKTGNRRRLPRAHRNRSGHRGPAEAIRQAPEAMQPESDGQKSLQRRSTAKIRCGTHRKTVDNRKPGGQSRCKGDRRQKSGAETATKRLTTGNRTNKSRRKGDRQPKIRCGTQRKTVDSRKPDGQKSLQRRSAAKNPVQKPPQDD